MDRCMRGRPKVVRKDGAIEVPLTQGQVALVDADKYELVKHWVWCARRWRYGYYAQREVQTGVGRAVRRICLMHRVILGVDGPASIDVDHRNHNTLDNRVDNLRLATGSQNAQNRRPRAGRSSRFKGVYWHGQRGKWVAQIKHNGRCHHLGLFTDEEAAARVYDAAALERFGDFAKANVREAS